MDTRWKAIIAVEIIIITLTGVFLFTFIHEEKAAVQYMHRTKESAVLSIIDTIKDMTATVYRKKIESFASVEENPEMLKAFARQDRAELIRLTTPYFEKLKQENSAFYTIFFILPDNTNLLHIHKPGHFGKKKKTFLLREVNRTHQPLSGFEVVKYGLLYRIAQPVFYKGEYIGLVGFAIDPDAFIAPLREKLNSKASVLVLSSLHKRVTHTREMETIDHGKYILHPMGNKVVASLPPGFDFDEHGQDITIDERQYHLISDLRLRDPRGEIIAKLAVTVDVTEQYHNYRRMVLYAFQTAVAMLVLSFIILYYSFGALIDKIVQLNMHLKDQNTALEIKVQERTEELSRSLRAKALLFKEVHHRVKNNMAVMLSLLNMQKQKITGEENISAFKQSIDRIMSMALVHEQLYQSKDLSHVNVDEYFESLISNLIHSYNFRDEDIKINISVDVPPMTLDRLVPCGLLVNELVSNSLKHAFHDNKTGEINVSLRTEGARKILIISDNGKGIPEGFNLNNAKSLGLKIVHSLTTQLRGTIEFKVEKGTTFTITFTDSTQEAPDTELPLSTRD